MYYVGIAVVKVIYSKRKTLCLQVMDTGEVIARVPLQTSQQRIQAFIDSHESWIERSLVKARQRQNATVYLTSERVEELRLEAQSHLVPRVYELANQMGVRPRGVTIRNQKTRWGSCSARQTLSLNCQLMVLPPELRDYVIVHELCHLVHFNHSSSFWGLVSECLPDAQNLRKRLRHYCIQPLALNETKES